VLFRSVRMTKMHYSTDWSKLSINSTFLSRVNSHLTGAFFGCGILASRACEWHVHPPDSYPPRETVADIISHIIYVQNCHTDESVGFVEAKIDPEAKPILDFSHFAGIV